MQKQAHCSFLSTIPSREYRTVVLFMKKQEHYNYRVDDGPLTLPYPFAYLCLVETKCKITEKEALKINTHFKTLHIVINIILFHHCFK